MAGPAEKKNPDYEIISFDIGGRNMAMAHIQVDIIEVKKGSKLVFDVIPPFRIQRLNRTDLGITKGISLEERVNKLYDYVNSMFDQTAKPQEITIERQFIANRKPGVPIDEENRMAESIMYMLLGLMRQRFPYARVHVVIPMLGRMKHSAEESQHMKKRSMHELGITIIKEYSASHPDETDWLKYTLEQDRQTDICEALMMALGASPVLRTS